MREIKFRAWDNKKKEWLLGYELKNLGGFSLFGESMLLGEWCSILNTFLFSRDGYEPEDLKVMQYTGVKDKNRREIFEGDIVKDDSIRGGMWVVCWNAEMGSWADTAEAGKSKYGLYKSLGTVMEVVGNIYENPELLNQ